MPNPEKPFAFDLSREPARREKANNKQRAQHSKLAARLAEVEAELADLGVDLPRRRGRKPGRPKGNKNKPKAAALAKLAPSAA